MPKRLLISLLLCLAIITVLVSDVIPRIVNVPFWDEWNWVYLFEKMYGGSLRFTDIWEPYGVHRNVFPRLLMLVAGYITRWDVRIEVAINILLAIAGFGIVLLLVRKIFPIVSRPYTILAPILASVWFSYTQYENWMIGGNTVMFMTVLAVVLGIWFLAKDDGMYRRQIPAILCGIIASYSCALGLAYWIAGAWVILERRIPSIRKRNELLTWGAAAFITVALYVSGNSGPREGYTPATVNGIWSILTYMLIYIARPITSMTISHTDLMIAGGLGAIISALILVGYTHIYFPKYRTAYAPFIAFMIFVAINSAVTASGRSGMGIIQASSSRYTTISNLFWISWFILAMFIIRSWIDKGRYRLLPLAICFLGFVLFLSVASSYRSRREIESFHTRFVIGRQKLLSGEVCVPEVFGESSRCKPAEVDILRRYSLSVFSVH